MGLRAMMANKMTIHIEKRTIQYMMLKQVEIRSKYRTATEGALIQRIENREIGALYT